MSCLCVMVGRMHKAMLIALLVWVHISVGAQSGQSAPHKNASASKQKVPSKAQTLNPKKAPAIGSKSKPVANKKAQSLPYRAKVDATRLAVFAPMFVPDFPPIETQLGSEQLDIAVRVHQGDLPCEQGIRISVNPDQNQPGYFDVRGKGFHYRMHPVHTTTGAIRLEDKKSGTVWLQLANKSMLMDQKKGRRIADDCAHPEQVAVAQDMKTNPPPQLFDTNGMGR